MNPSSRQNDPFEPILNQIINLMHMVQTCANMPISTQLPADLVAKVDKLERDVMLFLSLNETVTHQAKMQSQNSNLSQSMDVSRDSQRFIKRLEGYVQEVESLRLKTKERIENDNIISTVSQSSVEQGQQKKQENLTPDQRKRKKFRSVGGNKNWIPM